MVVWSSFLEIGVASIDIEHKHIIDFANLIEQTSELQQARLYDDKMLNNLFIIFRVHFQKEEYLMSRLKYPAIAQHSAEHETMLTRFKICMSDYKAVQNISPLMELITEWADIHITKHDMSLAAFIQQNKLVKQKKA